VLDWYSPNASVRASKQVLRFEGFRTVIEATELGDLLGLAGAAGALDWGFGIETPSEGSNPARYLDRCGQSATITYFMHLLDTDVPSLNSDPGSTTSPSGRAGPGHSGTRDSWQPPNGTLPSNASPPFSLQNNYSWAQIWMYRRNVLGTQGESSVHVGSRLGRSRDPGRIPSDRGIGWTPPGSVFPGDTT